jgi:transcriptional regulator with XRE-family HTH domain
MAIAPTDEWEASLSGIGTRLRHARLTRGARLKDVAGAAGCSESLVSKIENNKAQPSLRVLHKICAVLKVNFADLFVPPDDASAVVMHNGQRPVIELDASRRGAGIRMERVIPYARGHLLQSNIHIVAPGGASDGLISHEGEEVGYIIAGELELIVGDKTYSVSAGDTFCFRSELEHGYRNRGKNEARILFVNTPPILAFAG